MEDVIDLKKVFRLVSSLVAVIIMTTGCSDNMDNIIIEQEVSQGSQSSGVKLDYFGYKVDSLNVTAIEHSIQGFMSDNPEIKISYDGVKGIGYWSALEKRFSSGNLDDIFMIDRDHVLEFGEENQLEDLSDISSIENYGTLASSQFLNDDGSVYFLPTCVISYGLYCNLDMLKENGFEVPENYAEFSEICDYFISKGVTPVVANNYTSVRNIIIAKGLYPVYQSENCTEEIEKFNSGEKNIAEVLHTGIELAGEFLEKGWIDSQEALNTTATQDDLALFEKGDRPFMLTGSWATPRVKEEADFNYAVYPYPFLEDGCVLITDIATCVSINADSDNKAETKKFLEYITQPDVMWEYCDSQSSFSPLKDNKISSDKTIHSQIPYLTNGRSVIGSDFNLQIPLDDILYQINIDMLGGMSTNDAAEKLDKLVTEYLQEADNS